MDSGGPPQTSVQLNFFGAVATLEGLRRLLAQSSAPRAVAVSSIASLSSTNDPELVDACLSGDEQRAIHAATEFAKQTAPLEKMTPAQAMQVGLGLHSNAKYALNCWCRRAASKPEWAGAGVILNVIAPGFIDTPAAAYILKDPERSALAGRQACYCSQTTKFRARGSSVPGAHGECSGYLAVARFPSSSGSFPRTSG